MGTRTLLRGVHAPHDLREAFAAHSGLRGGGKTYAQCSRHLRYLAREAA